MGKMIFNIKRWSLWLAGMAPLLSLSAATHFTPAFQGNGRDHLNIYLLEASVYGVPLQAGDEIAAFDGTICCGVFEVSQPLIYPDGNFGVIHASLADAGQSNGFTPGHRVTLRFWDSSAAKEYSFVYIQFLNTAREVISPLPYEALGSLFVRTAVRDLSAEVYVNLEGALKGKPGDSGYLSLMRTDLNDIRILPGQCYSDEYVGTHYTPAGQPFSTAPWNYFGREGELFDSQGDPSKGKAGYPPTVVDWVLVSLKDKQETGGNSLCRAAGLLHRDGKIEFVGSGFSCGNPDPAKNYFLLVEQRNHILLLSDAVDITSGQLYCNFRDRQSFVDTITGPAFYTGQKLLSPGRYAMYAGNGNQSGTYGADRDITVDDRTSWETGNGIIGSYTVGDYDMSGDCNLLDRIIWEMNNGIFSGVP